MKGKVMLGLMAVLVVASLAFVACAAPALSPTPSPRPSPSPTVAPSPTPTPTPSPVVKWPSTFTMTSRPVGTQANMVSVAFSKFLEKYTPALTKISEQATSQRAWYPVNAGGEGAMTVDTGLDAWYSWSGEEPFPGRFNNLRTLGSVLAFEWGPMARGDANIKTLADMKKRAPYRFAAQSGVPQYIRWETALLKAAGLTRKDIVEIPVVNPNEAMRALLEGRADVAGIGGLGMPAFLQAQQVTGSVAIPMDWKEPGVAEAFSDIKPCFPFVVPAGFSPAVTEPIARQGSGCLVVVNKNMDAEMVYAITKLMYEHLVDEFSKESDWFRISVSLQGGRDGILERSTMVIPYHEGAVRFYKEKGLWTQRHEQAQQLLFKEPPEYVVVAPK